MTTLLAIDPGVKNLGWAAFDRCCLRACGLSRATAPAQHAENVHEGWPCMRAPMEVVLEQMTTRGGTAIRAEDLLRVSEVGAFVAGSMRPAVFRLVPVMAWKGSIPKDIHHRRVLAVLRGVEQVRLNRDLEKIPKSLQHNVIDAVGLGLYGVGRRA